MGLILSSVNSISSNVLCFKLRPNPSLSVSWAPALNYCVVLTCYISLWYVNLKELLHLGVSSLTYNIDALEMSRSVDIRFDHLGDCPIITDLFLWKLMDSYLFIQQITCWLRWFTKLWGFSREQDRASYCCYGN